MENTNHKLSDEAKLLELYKELGSDVRHFDRHIYIVNLQMIPALVIGLLVLYGRIEKFVGIEFEHPDAVYPIVWIGCFLISLMWIIAVSRFAQVYHIHAKTRQQCERILGLNGHRKISQMDKGLRLPKLTSHYILRLFGFCGYFFLLLISLFRCPNDNVIEWCVRHYFLCGCLFLLSGVVTLGFGGAIFLRNWMQVMEVHYGGNLIVCR